MGGNKPPLAHTLVWCVMGLHRHAHERQLMCKELTLYERLYECMQLWLHQQTNPTRLISVEPNDVISSNKPISLSVQPETFTWLISVEPNDVISSDKPISLSVQPEIFTRLISVEPNDVISSNEPISLSVQPETFTRLISVEPNGVISSDKPISLSVQPETFHCHYYRKEWASGTAVSNISCV